MEAANIAVSHSFVLRKQQQIAYKTLKVKNDTCFIKEIGIVT